MNNRNFVDNFVEIKREILRLSTKKRNYINFIHLYSIGTVGVKPNIIFLEDYEKFEDL